MQNIIFLIISILVYVGFTVYLRIVTNNHIKIINGLKKELSEKIEKFTESQMERKKVSDFKGVQFKGNRPPLRDVTTYD